MKGTIIAALTAALLASATPASSFRAVLAFQGGSAGLLSERAWSSTGGSPLLFAKKRKNAGGPGGGGGAGSGGKGFGSGVGGGKGGPKYSIDDKSYGVSPPASPSPLSEEEARAGMADFFSEHDAWGPLFRNVMKSPTEEPPALLHLADVDHPEQLFGISTLEGSMPWRLLPPKPSSNSSLAVVSDFLDEWQRSLLDIPLDAVITGENDLHFLEEGRRTIATTRFHVLDGDGDGGWEAELFRTCWSEIGHLSSRGEVDTGSLILLPDHVLGSPRGGEEGGTGAAAAGGLDRVREFVKAKLQRPIDWLGRGGDWEIVAMKRGSVGVRMLYRLGDMPDPSERYDGGDEEIAL